jgi:hypothetical protein
LRRRGELYSILHCPLIFEKKSVHDTTLQIEVLHLLANNKIAPANDGMMRDGDLELNDGIVVR